MGFERVWDSSCPHVWDSWETDGKTYVIQDLPPEDDEEALEILIEHLVRDEALCAQANLINEPESVEGISNVWRPTLAKRTSLGCYTEVNGKKTLVALNCCLVACKEDKKDFEAQGKAWKSVCDVMIWMESQRTAYDYIGADKYLSALGLVVKREFRGAKLGGRLLNAREPLCRHLGLKGTATVFTGPASQKLSANCGFTTIFEATWKDLADAGLDYPRLDKVIKFDAKKYE